MSTTPIPRTGRIVAGGSRLQTYTTRQLPNGLFLHQRRAHYGWGHVSPGWTIHRSEKTIGESLGYGRTLAEAVAKASTINPKAST